MEAQQVHEIWAFPIQEVKYIAFLNADDYWLSEKLSVQINFLNNNQQFGMVHSNAYILTNNKNFGKAQLICSQFKTKSDKGQRKHLACNDLKATPR